MIYMENVLVCIAAPLAVALLFVRGNTRRFIGFFLVGFLCCLASAYANSYLAVIAADNGEASLTAAESVIQLTPVCEELMKALPVFFFAAIFTPKRRDIITVALAVGLGFATLESVCYLMQYGAADTLLILIRGFCAGLMHALCAAILGYGLCRVQRERFLVIPCAFGLLCVTSTFHATYNLLAAADGAWRTAGYVLPFAIATVMVVWMQSAKFHRED